MAQNRRVPTTGAIPQKPGQRFYGLRRGDTVVYDTRFPRPSSPRGKRNQGNFDPGTNELFGQVRYFQTRKGKYRADSSHLIIVKDN